MMLIVGFDVAPFALPGCEPGEVRFEEPREVVRVEARFSGPAPEGLRLERLVGPATERDVASDRPFEQPCWYGWVPIDDQFNTRWVEAGVERSAQGDASVFEVQPLRTLGVRVVPAEGLESVRVFTTGAPAETRLRVHLDCGGPTREGRFGASGYNAVVGEPEPAGARCYEIPVRHMVPRGWDSGDDGLVTIDLGNDLFTVSLTDLAEGGPIWYEHRSVFVTRADDPTSFEQYRAAHEGAQTVAQMVSEHAEQSLARAINGQPKPHWVSTALGFPHSRHRYRLEANGDLYLHKPDVTRFPGPDTPLWKAAGSARFLFGLEHAVPLARYPDPSPVLTMNARFRRGSIEVEQRAFAAPLMRSPSSGELRGDEPTAALVRFTFTNRGAEPTEARLTVGYSQDSARSQGPYATGGQDDRLVPTSGRDKLAVEGDALLSGFEGERVVRAVAGTTMQAVAEGGGVRFSRPLAPGASCQLVLKVPFVAPDAAGLEALRKLDFERLDRDLTGFWREEGARGAQIRTPEPRLDALHRAQPAHVAITDFAMPDGSGLINTSVGTSTYGNFTNESCMVIHDLDERGRHADARRRLDLLVKYQGTAPQPGNFTDFDGMFFGAGGFEEGAYNQHHGWAMWALAEHYLITRDSEWMARTAPAMVAGADWVFRQRLNTKAPLPHSRGWERGLLPAGSLEDVTDFQYWLSTNAVTWRGVNAVAEALAKAKHPEAGRITVEAAAYRADILTAFDAMRVRAPLVRLRDGRSVPHVPSRIYRRGRDVGWIRETLEGAIYLLIGGLVEPDTPMAGWILDDYQDNRYLRPPYGYGIADEASDLFGRGGFSIQPNLLGGLLPYLDRDEPEVAIWMLMNGWAACLRGDVNALAEHPMPVLGFSNEAQFKTSDEANACSWLRSLFVYASRGVLHLGRALPRAWFADGERMALVGAATRFGRVSVSYRSELAQGRIVAEVETKLHEAPGRALLRFRHPEGRPIARATVEEHDAEFDPVSGDVELPATSGHHVVVAEYD